MSLPKLVAGALASLLMSLIWFLASPKEAQPQNPTQALAELAALRTPVTLTLASGERVAGELQGADSLCADWPAALQATPQTAVTLPDGRSVTGADVRGLTVGRSPVAGLEAMSSVSACPETLTVHAPGSAATGLGVLKDAASSAAQMTSSAAQMKGALKSLTQP